MKDKNIDLHIHTCHSDGEKNVNEILKMARDLELSVISFTDHDSYDAYSELEKKDIGNMFNIRIIPGCEILTEFDGETIEILAYGGIWREIDKWLKNYYSDDNIKKRDCIIFDRIIKRIKENKNIKISDNLELPKKIPYSGYYKFMLFEDMRKFIDNNFFFKKYGIDNFKDFNRKGLYNKESELFVNVEDLTVGAKDIVDLIHKNNRNSISCTYI